MPSEPRKPTRFGSYNLLERISHGGMAEVFRAVTQGDGGFEREVAIKLLLPQVASDEEFVTMLIDEAKIAGQLNHANIAQIFDLGRQDDRYFIVQEFVPGRDVRTILRHLAEHKRQLGVAQACHIVLKMSEGLHYAHNKRDRAGTPLNLVHRDVSPQNVIVSYEGEIKLIDFGIVKAEGRTTSTQTGLVKGKFAYMSPEQLRGLPVDRRSDVFACGIVLHELLTGHPLFKRATEFETLRRARSGVIEPPSQFHPAIPPELDRIALKALARHVDDRYQSAVTLRDDLWEFVRESGNLCSREELARWMRETFPPDDEPDDYRSDGLGDMMTLVDPQLQGRILADGLVDGERDAGDDPDVTENVEAPARALGVRELARTAMSEPARAVITGGVLPSSDREEEETTSERGQSGPKIAPSARVIWIEPQTPTTRKPKLEQAGASGDVDVATTGRFSAPARSTTRGLAVPVANAGSGAGRAAGATPGGANPLARPVHEFGPPQVMRPMPHPRPLRAVMSPPGRRMPMTPSPGPVPLGSNPYGTPYPGAVPTAPANRRWWLLGGAVLVLVAAAVLSIVLAATSG